MDDFDELRIALRARAGEMIALTRELVTINSYSKNVDGVNAVGALLQSALTINGLSWRRELGDGCGDHHFWSTAAAQRQPPILLIGHHDTVFPPGTFEGFREEAGRGFGPGCLDMKGGLAIICVVMRTLADAGLLAEIPIVVASVADEEVGSLNSREHLLRIARGAAAAAVFEAGRVRDEIVVCRRGVGGLQVTAHGKAAHAGNAHADGANAIWSLSRFIDYAQAQTDYASGVTVNVGLVQGGTSANTVPAAAEATLDLRFNRVADADELMRRLHDASVRCAAPNTQLDLRGGIKRLPMELTAASQALYEEYAACQRAAGLGHRQHPLVGGGSDANTVAAIGVPTIDGLGPRGAGFHTHQEYVELDSFGPKAEALLCFLLGRMQVARGTI